MKRKLCLSFLLISFSAFAFSLNCYTHTTKPVARVAKKTAYRSGIAPLADMALLPALIG